MTTNIESPVPGRWRFAALCATSTVLSCLTIHHGGDHAGTETVRALVSSVDVALVMSVRAMWHKLRHGRMTLVGAAALALVFPLDATLMWSAVVEGDPPGQVTMSSSTPIDFGSN